MPRVSGQCALTCPTYRPVLLIIYIGASTIGLYFKNVSNPVYFLLAIRRGSLQKTTALPLIYALAIKKGCAEMHKGLFAVRYFVSILRTDPSINYA